MSASSPPSLTRIIVEFPSTAAYGDFCAAHRRVDYNATGGTTVDTIAAAAAEHCANSVSGDVGMGDRLRVTSPSSGGVWQTRVVDALPNSRGLVDPTTTLIVAVPPVLDNLLEVSSEGTVASTTAAAGDNLMLSLPAPFDNEGSLSSKSEQSASRFELIRSWETVTLVCVTDETPGIPASIRRAVSRYGAAISFSALESAGLPLDDDVDEILISFAGNAIRAGVVFDDQDESAGVCTNDTVFSVFMGPVAYRNAVVGAATQSPAAFATSDKDAQPATLITTALFTGRATFNVERYSTKPVAGLGTSKVHIAVSITQKDETTGTKISPLPSLGELVLRPLDHVSIASRIPPATMEQGVSEKLQELAANGIPISEGDVIEVSFAATSNKDDRPSTAAAAEAALNATEGALARLLDALADNVPPPNTVTLLVVAIRTNTATPAGIRSGILTVAGVPSPFSFSVKASPSAVRLLERPACAVLPPMPSIGMERVASAMSLYNKVGESLQRLVCAQADRPSGHPATFTIFGGDAVDSGALPAATAALNHAGLPFAVVDARGLIKGASSQPGAPPSDESALLEMIQLLISELGPSAVVVRNAQSVAPRGVVARFLLGETTNTKRAEASSEAAVAALPSGNLENAFRPIVVLLSESAEAVDPTLAAAATVEPLRWAVLPDTDRLEVVSSLLPFCASDALRSGDAATTTPPRFVTSLTLRPATLSSWSTGMTFGQLCGWIRNVATDTLARAPSAAPGATDTFSVVPVVSEEHFEAGLKVFQRAHGQSITSTTLQPVRWSDVGGLEDAKRELLETIQLPMTHPELFEGEDGEGGAKRRAGILLYGPPGCGKTLLAKAVATEMNMNFLSVKGPELINMYVGESEKNIRQLFQRARDNSPCVVFFDEIDALAPSRGAKGDSGGVMDRIVAQLLAEVDGVGAAKSDGTPAQVFIVAATNRPDLLDQSLLRPGRFDKLCYLGVPSTKEEQLFALSALTRKFHLAKDVDLVAVLEPLPFVFTGADLFALASDAMMLAVEETVAAAMAKIEETGPDDDSGHGDDSGADENDVVVCQRHFMVAREGLKPSVTAEDLLRYQELRSKMTT